MENYLDKDSLKNLKKTVAKCIAELGKKSDLSPQETKAAYDGACLYDWLCMMTEENDMAPEPEYGYSERRYSMRSPMRHVPMNYPMSRGYSGYPGYPSEFMNTSYCDPYTYDSGMKMSSNRMSHGEGYSRHSIGDRAVEKLENLMDSAGSEYEKEQLHKYIRMIRAAAEEG